MKNLTLVLVLLVLVLVAGCTQTHYTKSVEAHLDANGNLVKTIVTERAFQPNQSGWDMKFDYLKGVKTNND